MSKRRLAAIMFSDIVGYSTLLEQIDEEALNTRKKNQLTHKQLIKNILYI